MVRKAKAIAVVVEKSSYETKIDELVSMYVKQIDELKVQNKKFIEFQIPIKSISGINFVSLSLNINLYGNLIHANGKIFGEYQYMFFHEHCKTKFDEQIKSFLMQLKDLKFCKYTGKFVKDTSDRVIIEKFCDIFSEFTESMKLNIDECCVCYDKTKLYTTCGHFVCLECFQKIQKNYTNHDCECDECDGDECSIINFVCPMCKQKSLFRFNEN